MKRAEFMRLSSEAWNGGMRTRTEEQFEKFSESTATIAKAITGFEHLTPTQQKTIIRLVATMAAHHMGDQYIAEHYEIFHNPAAGDPQYKKYREMEDAGIFLAQGNSASFRALEKKGLIEFVKDGGSGIDKIKPLFTLDFSTLYVPE